MSKKRAAPSLLAENGIHLRSIALDHTRTRRETFPFSVPVIQSLTALEFTAPVTFLVGENGCGKSTLLEAIASAAGSITAGSDSTAGDPSLAPMRTLAQELKLVWSKRTHRGFFMRAEDFFGYARRMGGVRDELEQEVRNTDEAYKDRSATARGLAQMAYRRELAAMRRDYGEGVDARSHGESYLKFFQNRFVPDGLYLLDEPETPLSPTRQLSFLVMLKSMVAQNAQFIIATHSPIIMAFPGATILDFDGGHIRTTQYAQLEHVRITRDFLNNPEAYLRHLFDENPPEARP